MTARPAFELADVFRRHGEAYIQANAGYLGRIERRVIGAVAACRTLALGGHVERCDDCGLTRIAYNSCIMGRSSNGALAATWSRSCARRRQSGSPLRRALEERDRPVGRLERAAPQMR